jgi:heme-degrading monooxygenase HmoA
MVTEHALITVRPGSAAQFERAMGEARAVIGASPGFLGLTLHRGVETPERYLLLVEWETLEDHTEGFRQSEAFAAWRALIGPFFESQPVVDHVVTVEGFGR